MPVNTEHFRGALQDIAYGTVQTITLDRSSLIMGEGNLWYSPAETQ